MKVPLLDISCANLPCSALAALAEIRCTPGVQVALTGERAWVRWQPGDDIVLRRVFPVPGAVLYLQREGKWYRYGPHLPAFEVPAHLDYQPLHRVLTPDHFVAEPIPAIRLQPVKISLAPDSRLRRTTALRCTLTNLRQWIETVPSPRLASLRAARYEDQVLLLGTRLPLLPDNQRFWGKSLLIPLGYRPEPDLPETAIRNALGVDEEELVILNIDGAEVIPHSALQPATRAGLRLPAGEVV